MARDWYLFGLVFFAICKLKYKEKFGLLIEIISDEDAAVLQTNGEELRETLDSAIDTAIPTVLERRAAALSRPAMDFNYFLP